jgi:hypothetical protein
MNATPAIDTAAAHKHFSSACFNQAWDYIDKKDRSTRDEQAMVALAHASIYHWMQRPDCTDQQLSVGYWQASRVHALLGHALEARRLAETCLSYSKSLPPFFLAYAHEAIARAEGLSGNAPDRDRHLAQARKLAEALADADERAMLIADLETVR